MAVTKQQRRAALIALMLTASTGGGYVAKDDLIAIGQRYCGPVPRAVLELPDGQRMEATPQNVANINAGNPTSVIVKLDLGKAQGLLAAWCDLDRQRLDDGIDMQLTKGDQ